MTRHPRSGDVEIPPSFHRWPPGEQAAFFDLNRTREQLMVEIGEYCGFEHDESHDRLRKEELVRIRVVLGTLLEH